jgi:glucose/arabinose dehydrogenase
MSSIHSTRLALTMVALAASISSVSILAQAAPTPPPLSSSVHTFATQGFADVVRIQRNGDISTIATGLAVTTAMTFGPDGKLYVSNLRAGAPGTGQIVRIDLP